MFDPTAFENMKVVLEGALYDLDLSGEIVILNRNDCMNMAKLSRNFEIYFALASQRDKSVNAKLSLESHLRNLAAELLPDSLSETLAGSYIHLEFIIHHQHKIADYRKLKQLMVDIWGANRKVSVTSVYDPLADKFLKSIVSIEFARLIREDQLDDLVEMIEVMKMTLEQLKLFQEL